MSNRSEDNRLFSNFQIGLIAIVVTVFAFYLAFAKSLPFTGDGYTVKAVFSDAQNIRANSPVRVSGVQVGEVTKIEHLTDANGDGQDAAVVTMKVSDDGRPVREDATLQLRPRLFLEGNLFVDMQPGSPEGDELESGSIIPMEQTSISVQFDQVLTSLQAPVRDNLQIFLKEFGIALCGENPPQGACEPGSGGEGFREAFRTSPAAYSSSAQVNEALLGREPGDLAGFVRNVGTVFEALNRNQSQLQDLVTNFRIVTGSFAAESEALEQAIVELPVLLAEGRPALAKFNDALPELRAFARAALPGTRAANKALDHANPWIGQVRKLVSKKELRGLVKDLRPTIPSLARLAKESLPFLEQARALASCFSNTVIPWSNTQIPADAPPGADVVYKETGYSLAGVAGESRSGDAQGQWFRVLGSGGPNTFSLTSPDEDIGQVAGLSTFPLLGVQPAIQSAAKTPFHPEAPCENQDPPDLGSDPGEAPATTQAATPTTFSGAPAGQQSLELLQQVMELKSLEAAGEEEQAADAREQILGELDKLGLKPKDLPLIEQQAVEILGSGAP